MDYRRIFQDRKSIRNFKHKKVERDDIDEVFDYFKESKKLLEDIHIELKYFENGEEFCNSLKGIGGYYGNMIEAPHYLLFLSEEVNNHQINVGYCAESVITKLTELGIDSCWVIIPENGEMVKNALNIKSNLEAAAVIGIGYRHKETKILNEVSIGDNYSYANMKVVEDNVSARLALEEIVYWEKWGNMIPVEKLISLGLHDVFYYARMAPSTLNRQPWRYLIKDRDIILAIRRDEGINNELNLIDAGIAMYYMDVILREDNIKGSWKICKPDKTYEIPKEFYIISHFS